ncbi:PAS domain-containing protein [Pontibacter sp. JH31]|uniref:PAS domain-containing protein n=1 Tax=Pontibacter aquaedesilientis TaxID=2766980 RepID=A0ABR7XDJ0_9BACT|nr:chemotaxis protein CheB [Pontibacter aquaedesilientis]MBD1396365.1 PAS domain-containing protein [Pontibacter aquaedesilientis]
MSQQLPKTNRSKVTPRPADHYLVGIGASAGGLEAIHKLFDHFPSNSSFAFVIIQHLSPDHKSLMAELLSKHTRMQVQEAEDNMFTRPNCVYVLPSGKQLTLQHGRLRLTEKPRSREPNFAVDVFFESLAIDRGKYAIGIVLSGTGTDGSKGVKAIKQAGGLVVVQDPESAKFDGMPRSAIDTGDVDFVLTADKMSKEIIEHTRRMPLLKSIIENGRSSAETDEEAVLQEILELVCSHTQMDFTNYKMATINRRVHKRMQHLKLESMEAYLHYLHDNPAEIKQLCQEFFINVTSFFRDQEVFELLKDRVIPEIIQSKKANEPVKVWVAACSTGEEVYSLAILFCEVYHELGIEPNVKLFATDIDQRALQQASKGTYNPSISKNVSQSRLERFFQKKGNKYEVSDQIRKMVIFAQHDLQKDPPFSKIDLITCRNMLIYLNPALQNKVLSLFPYALNKDGFLLLGPSEHIGNLKEYFAEEDRKWKLFRKIKDRTGTQQSYGIKEYVTEIQPSQASQYKTTQLNRYNEAFMDALAEDFKVTALYVDASYQLLHGIGDINRFLKFPDKRLHFNLIKMVPEELAVTLSVGIRKALKNNRNVIARQVAVKFGKKEKMVNVSIRPVTIEKGQPKIILVLLQEMAEVHQTPKISELSLVSDSDYYQQLTALEMELKETRDNLQMTVQDLSTANEELQSSNEELMSSNEELQSSNEEMQSLNEELHTVNSEHQLKIKELQELNEDLDNYFRSSNIGQLFVDHNLYIRKYTPSIESIVNIIGGDIGRPVYHLSHSLKYSRLVEDIQYVNNTSNEVEHEVETTEGRYFLMRIIPYLKRDGNKDGVVISFVDVTTLRTLSSVVNGVLNSSLSSIMAFKAVRDENMQIKDFNWTLLNKQAESMLGKSSANLTTTSVLSTLPILYKSGLFKKFVAVVESDKSLHAEHYLELNGSKAWYEIVAVKMGDGLTVTMADITDKKNSEDRVLQAFEDLKIAEENLLKLNNELEKIVADRTRELAESDERFRLVSMATNDVVWDWNLASNDIWWSDSLHKVLGYEEQEMIGGANSWFDKLHPEDRDTIVKSINKAINERKEQWSGEYRIREKGGDYIYVSNRAYIQYNEYQMPYRVIGSFIDLTDLKQAQEELQDTNAHLLRVIEDLDTFVYTASHDLKSPIANIEGLMLLLEEQIAMAGPLPGEPTEPLFVMIKDSIARFKNVIRDLTDIAKVQRDVDGDAEPLSLEELYQTVYLSLKEEATKKHAVIKTDFSEAPAINFSRKNMYSILYNLVSNAIKYSSPDKQPEVQIKSSWDGKSLVLTVQDNGLGMNEEQQGKLFTLFKRFHSHVDGTGMGLYIVKRIIDNSGGEIKVDSKVGQGTTFRLYFKKE